MVPLYFAEVQRKGVGADRERMKKMLHFLTNMTHETFIAIHSMAFVAEMTIAGVIEWRRYKLRKEEAEAKKLRERRKREKMGWYGMEAERLYYRYSEPEKKQKCA